MVTHSGLSQNREMLTCLSALAQAAESIAAPPIRNMGTVGGNLASASPAGDLPPALLAYDAAVIAESSARGRRRVKMAAFNTGYKQTALEKDELLVEVRIPVPSEKSNCFFRKVAARKAQACSKMTLALFASVAGQKLQTVRVGAASVAETPVLLKKVEDILRGSELSEELIRSARKLAEEEVKPIDDQRSTALYRRFVVGTVLEDFLLKLMNEEA